MGPKFPWSLRMDIMPLKTKRRWWNNFVQRKNLVPLRMYLIPPKPIFFLEACYSNLALQLLEFGGGAGFFLAKQWELNIAALASDAIFCPKGNLKKIAIYAHFHDCRFRL